MVESSDTVLPSASSKCQFMTELRLLFQDIASSPSAFFRLQQRDEPDMTVEEKLNFLAELYSSKPALFLCRYEQYISADQVDKLFDTSFESTDAADVKFLVDRIKRHPAAHTAEASSSSSVEARNRRYIKLKRMLNDKQDEYFTDKEMRKRQPLLYDQMIGKYQTSEEFSNSMHANEQQGERDNPKLSSMLLDIYDNQVISERKRNEKLLEDISGVQIEEHDDEDASEEEDVAQIDQKQQQSNLADKELSRKLFFSEMVENFMQGDDAEFYDYESNSNDPETEKEILKLQDQDEQDRYFDEESDFEYT